MSDRLTEIRARLDAATPGPWVPDDECVLRPASSPHGRFLIIAECHDGGHLENDARLIASAPSDIEWLLDEVEHLREWGAGWQRGYLAYERTYDSLTPEDLDA